MECDGELAQLGQQDGRFLLDSLAADLLEDSLGEEGALAASEVRTNAAARWSAWEQGFAAEAPWERWREGGRQFIRLLAHVCWRARVRPGLASAGGAVAALSMPFAEHVFAPTRPDVVFRDRQWFDGRGLAIDRLRSDPFVGIPSMDEAAFEGLVARGASLLKSVNAQRLVWWLVATCHRQVLEGLPNPACIVTEGGWQRLSRVVLEAATGRAITRVNGSDSDEIKGIVVALERRSDIRLSDGTVGRLLALRTRRAGRARSALVEITLTEAWLPFFVKRLGKRSRDERRARLLVPVLPPPQLPRRVSPQFHPPLTTLARDLVFEMARRSVEIVAASGLPLTRAELAERGEHLSLPSRIVDSAWELWLENEIFAEPGVGLVALGAHHAEAWDFIVESGRRRTSASARRRVSRHRGAVR
jgi:hypothetical protein